MTWAQAARDGDSVRGAALRDDPSSLATWLLREGKLTLDRPTVIGIINLTPDSFSDGGAIASPTTALERARKLVDEGADLIDVGGESTRPGAAEVPSALEINRILPFVRLAVNTLGVPISVDTRKADVARVVLSAGAAVINDVSGLSHDSELGHVVAEAGAGLVLMHMRGTPETMQGLAQYEELIDEISAELGSALDRAADSGIDPGRVVLDPGIGFAKNTAHNLELLRRLEELGSVGRPLLLGPSRKRFLGEILGAGPRGRVEGTISACLRGYEAGVRLFRVHDVAPVRRALDVAHAIRNGLS